ERGALEARVADDAPEAPAREVRRRRDGPVRALRRRRDAEQALRRHDDERLAPGAEDLAAQHVEELGRRRQVADLDVVFRAVREEALEPGARVLGALALVAVRQEEDHSREAPPLV